MESQMALPQDNPTTHTNAPTATNDAKGIDMPLSEYPRHQSLQASSRFLHKPFPCSLLCKTLSVYSVESSENNDVSTKPVSHLLRPPEEAQAPQARVSSSEHGHGILYHNEGATALSCDGNCASDETRALDLLAIVATLRLIILNSGLDVDVDPTTTPSHICAHDEAGARNCVKKMKSMPRTATQREATNVEKLRGLTERLGIKATQTSKPNKNKIRRKRKRLNNLSSGRVVVDNDPGLGVVQETVESSAMPHDNNDNLIQAETEEPHQMRREDEQHTRVNLHMYSQAKLKQTENQEINKHTESGMPKQEATEFAKDACQNPQVCPEFVDFHNDDDNVSQAQLNVSEIQIQKNKSMPPVMSNLQTTDFVEGFEFVNFHHDHDNVCQAKSNETEILIQKKEATEFESRHLCPEETAQSMCYAEALHEIQGQQQTSISDDMEQSSSSSIEDDNEHSRRTGSEDLVVQNDIGMPDVQSSPRMDDSIGKEDANRTEAQQSDPKISSQFVIDEQNAGSLQEEEPNKRPKRASSYMLPSRFSDSILQPYWGRPIRTIRRKPINKKVL